MGENKVLETEAEKAANSGSFNGEAHAVARTRQSNVPLLWQ
jgi:hypothetical protein